MNKLYISLSAAMILASSACTRTLTEFPGNGRTTVGFGIENGVQTRTAMDLVHGTSEWEDGDALALWAQDSEGRWMLQGSEFSFFAKGHGSTGYFSAEISSPMPEGNYSYYLTYPVPASIEGTVVTFDIPCVQDGTASGSLDIMTGGPAVSGALRSIDSGSPVTWTEDRSNILDVRMKHLLHFLRFYIPDGRNILGEPVERIELTMPQAVAGTLSVDITDGQATFTGGAVGTDGRTVTMDLGSPMGESSGFAYDYAAAGIYPPSEAYGDEDLMEVTLYSAHKIAQVAPIKLGGRDFKAGHITSVPLKPLSAEDFYCVDFSLDSNNLGEDIEIITLALPEGTSWPGTESNTYTISTGISVGNSFRISTNSEDEFRVLSGKSVTVSYESENAIVYESFSFEDLSSVSKSAKSLNCPYLLFEDFSGVGTFQSNDGPGSQSTGSKAAYTFLDGWSMARAGAEEGKAVRMSGYRYRTNATHPSRCDSPMLSGIKDGSSVDVLLTFDYSMNKNESSSSTNGLTLYIGSTDVEGAIESASTAGTFEDSFHINSGTGSYDEIDEKHEVVLEGMTNGHRISWRNVPDQATGWLNYSTGTYWIYLDNIRVSIKRQ